MMMIKVHEYLVFIFDNYYTVKFENIKESDFFVNSTLVLFIGYEYESCCVR